MKQKNSREYKRLPTRLRVRLLTPRQLQVRFLGWLSHFNARLTHRYQSFLMRRPHRSFRRTRRRDYVRSLKLPGYIAFSHHVTKTVLGHRRVFVWLIAFYAVASLVLGGVTNQDTYAEINNLMKESSQTMFEGGIDKLGQAGLLLIATVSNTNTSLSADQQIYLGFMGLMTWLTTVWLLRELLLNRKPKLRDGLYSAGAPIIATIAIVLVLMVQLLPVGVTALAYSGMTSVGLANEGFGAMLFWVIAAIIAALVLYWATSTLVALVIVTLPGMYPLRALRVASDLVVGRRLRILYRWLWAFGVIAIAWVVVMVPIILLEGWLKDTWKQTADIPIIPVVVAVMSAGSVVWLASYVYLLYRRVVDDDAKPA